MVEEESKQEDGVTKGDTHGLLELDHAQAEQFFIKRESYWNFERVLLYWNIGSHIVEEEQNGKERADYGDYLIQSLADQLTREYGSGFRFVSSIFFASFI